MSQEELGKQVLELMNKKDKIQSEIKELKSILTQSGVGMDGPLWTSEGFRVNNVDDTKVSMMRTRVIFLQNELKALLEQIDRGLKGFYSGGSSSSSSSSSTQDTPTNTEQLGKIVHTKPFATISTVDFGSPAFLDGLYPVDDIVEFGSVNATNYKELMDIYTVVQHSEGTPVNVKLYRDGRYVTIQVTPRKWAGNGLLGCNIIDLC